MGPIGSPETSVQNYHSTLRNIPEERRAKKFKKEVQEEILFFMGFLTPEDRTYRFSRNVGTGLSLYAA
jgi:hypothetical protein